MSHVIAHSTIATDQHKTYEILGHLPQFAHYQVNHKENYVDPATGRHTQRIESEWQKLKEKVVKRAYGVSRKQLQSYLDRHAWMFQFGERRELLYNFWSQVQELFP
jgi:ISXO2-like transposase domain